MNEYCYACGLDHEPDDDSSHTKTRDGPCGVGWCARKAVYRLHPDGFPVCELHRDGRAELRRTREAGA